MVVKMFLHSMVQRCVATVGLWCEEEVFESVVDVEARVGHHGDAQFEVQRRRNAVWVLVERFVVERELPKAGIVEGERVGLGMAARLHDRRESSGRALHVAYE